jgi:hypothetical protein
LEGPFSAFLGFIAAGAGAGFLGGCEDRMRVRRDRRGKGQRDVERRRETERVQTSIIIREQRGGKP